MLKANDEGRSAEAVQEAESRPFVPVAAEEAVGVDLLDSPRGRERFAAQGPTALKRPVVEEPTNERPDETVERRPQAQDASSGAPRGRRRRPALLAGSAIFALAMATGGFVYWDH